MKTTGMRPKGVNLLIILLFVLGKAWSQNGNTIHGENSGYILGVKSYQREAGVEYFFLPAAQLSNLKLYTKYGKADKLKDEFGYYHPRHQDSLMDWNDYEVLSFSILRNGGYRISNAAAHHTFINCLKNKNYPETDLMTKEVQQELMSIEGKIRSVFYDTSLLLKQNAKIKNESFDIYIAEVSVSYCLDFSENDSGKKYIKVAYIYKLDDLHSIRLDEKMVFIKKFKIQ